MTRICLNAIVKNEADKITRMLDSVLGHIHAIAILDTGSTDDTIAQIETYGRNHGIPTRVGRGRFVNFEQARNDALALAHKTCDRKSCDYILLMDADMVFRAEPGWADGLQAEAYEVVQKAGGVSYTNVRLLRAHSPARYVGVTHEYLDVATSATRPACYFDDYADGSNRVDKFERDIRLLTADLDRDPNNARTWFYLANSYRDAGRPAEAVEAYRWRVELGGWDEEVWNAQVQLAGCLRAQGLDAAFVFEALKAYQMRPQRGEVIHDLAKHYRERGDNAIAAMFAEHGLGMARPDDRLFVADWVYHWGFREEMAIAGFYQAATRETGFKVNNALALDSSVPDPARHRARRDAVFYLPKLEQMCPSARFHEINFQPRRGYTAMNPCVTNSARGSLEVLLRTVNYRIDERGCYMIGETQCGDAPIETENHLLKLGHDLETVETVPVVWERPEPKFPLVLGLEDMRIFWHKGERHFYANVREQREDGQCVQYHGYLSQRFTPDAAEVRAALPISDGTSVEKNWVPFLNGDKAHEFVYRLDRRGILENNVVSFTDHPRDGVAVENISGSSQWIRFKYGMLAVVHEAVVHPSTGKRVYQHRFAWTTSTFSGLRLSLPFVFRDVQIEFCAGIATSPWGDEIVLSFGERDEKAWLASVKVKDIECVLGL